MASSQEVFALRKEGSLNEAYEMALAIVKDNPDDDWNIKALAYCLNDLIKRAVSQNNYSAAQTFASQLDNLTIDEYDDILVKTVRNAKLIANPQKKIIIEAKQLSFEGKDEEAYPLFKKASEQFPTDVDLAKSYGWTLYKLLKKAIESGEKVKRNSLLTDYFKIEKTIEDEKLLQSMNYMKDLADEEKQVIRDAKENSKKGNHQESLRLFKEAVKKFPDDKDLHEQFAWELQREGKIIFEHEQVNVLNARQLLADYIKLKNDRPSQLHSLFLRFADKIIDREEFNLISFLKLWDLKNLREEDFEPFKKEDKVYPSIAEKIIQHSAKLILNNKLNQEIDFFLPFLDVGIQKFQENIWLPYYKAKLLHLINRNEDAVEFLLPVVKEKISDYWTWSLLAELVIETDKEKAISCYCKALLCKGEDKFIVNVRTKFAELLIQKELWSEAKFEIASVIVAKEAEGAKVSDCLRDYKQSDWYKNATEKKHNNDFYNSHKQLAEEYVFQSLPWLDSCLGETFTIPEKPDKPRRKLFIRLPKEIIEVVISDRKFNTSRNFREGDSIRIKGEYDKEKSFQIYLLEKRNSQENWDLFEWHKGNVIQAIKNEVGKITAWRISAVVGEQIKEGIIDVPDIKAKFQIKEGLPVFVKLYQKEKIRSTHLFSLEKESRVHIHLISERPDGKLWDSFPEQIGIVDHINYEKGIAHFIISKRIDSIVKLNQLKEKIEIGTKLSVRLKKVTKEKETYFTLLTCSITDKEPTEKLLIPFSGMVETSGSFGFADEVYIDSSLMLEHKIDNTNNISGIAILNYNKKKGSWGWKAIKILSNVPVEKSEQEEDEFELL